MNLFRRSDLKVRYRMEQDGIEWGLGHLRELSSHHRSHEIPTSISLSWVGLEPGEELAPHFHHVPSHVIIQKGQASVLAPHEMSMGVGDFIMIPANVWHGFKLADQDGFEALAFNFNLSGLFSEDETTIFDNSKLKASKQTANLVRRSDKCFRDYDRLLPPEIRARWINLKEGKTEKVEYAGPTYVINFEGRCKITGEHQELELLSQDILYFDKPDTLTFSTLRKSTLFTLEIVDPETELEGLS